MPSLEKCLFTGLLLFLVTPLILSVSLHCLPHWLPNASWLRNETLVGMTVKAPQVSASWASLGNGTLQKSVADHFNTNFAGRELLIRLTTETWYRLFRQSPLASGIVLGQEDALFTEYHLTKYCLGRTSSDRLEPTVIKLRALQEACEKLGIACVVLITPSKASIQPENIPTKWLSRYDTRPKPYEQFLQLLKKHGVHFVDGPAITRKAKPHEIAPVFPKGGIHWGDAAAFPTSQALITAFQDHNNTLMPLEHGPVSVSDNPKGDDADLMALMNLMVPWRYPVASLPVHATQKSPGDSGLSAIFIGGSFISAIAEQLSASGQFTEVQSFFYYKHEKRYYGNGELKTVSQPVDQVDFDTEILPTDFLVIEINESFLDFTDSGLYVERFANDALKELLVTSRIPFPLQRLDEEYLNYQIGGVISFRAENHPFGETRSCLSGFSDPETEAAWTDGSTAILRISMSPPQHDLHLEASVGALIHPPQQPPQTVSLYANNQFIGEWKIDEAGAKSVHARIPKEFVSRGGRLVLRFEIAHPMSPASLGMGDDRRALGIWFSQLKLTELTELTDSAD